MSSKPMKKSKRHRKNTRSLTLALMIGGGLLLVTALAALGLRGSGSPGGVPVEVRGSPNLVVDREHVDLGPVKLGQWVEVSFEVANNGDQPLRFQREPYVSVVEGC